MCVFSLIKADTMSLVLAYTIIHSKGMAGLCSRSDSSDYEEVIERKGQK